MSTDERREEQPEAAPVEDVADAPAPAGDTSPRASEDASAGVHEAVSAGEPPAAGEVVAVDEVVAANELPPASDLASASDAAAASRDGGARTVTEAELTELQRAEEAKGDPALDDVEPASIDLPEGEREEPFEKLAAQAKRLSPERARAAVESLLFLADRPITPEEIRNATGLDVARVRRALDELSGDYREGISGVVLHDVAGGWQLRTAPDCSPCARRFLKVKPQRLTRAALETLAIIAYRQPVTRPEIEDIRGVDCGAVVKALLERRLIKIMGKKEEPGRPMLYGTTREFLEFFALKDLASLPTLREFHELSEEHRDIVEKETGAPEPARIEGLVSDLSDPNLRAALESKQAEGDAALEELERAMQEAEDKTRAAEAALKPPKRDEEPPAEA